MVDILLGAFFGVSFEYTVDMSLAHIEFFGNIAHLHADPGMTFYKCLHFGDIVEIERRFGFEGWIVISALSDFSLVKKKSERYNMAVKRCFLCLIFMY